jgi:hypothetical protein
MYKCVSNYSLIFFQHFLYFWYCRLCNCTMCLHLREVWTNSKHCMLKNYFFLIDAYSFVLIYRYMVFNYAGSNLHQDMERHRPFTEDHIKLIIYSLLRGLKVEILSLQLNIYLRRYPFLPFSLCIQLALFTVWVAWTFSLIYWIPYFF